MKKVISCLLIGVLMLCAAGCGQAQSEPKTAAAADLGSIMQQMLDTVSLPEMMTLTQDDLADYFGLDAQWYADAAAYINANGYEKDEIILVRAKDADSVSLIRSCLQQTLENAAAEMRNYIPEQYAMIQTCKPASKDLYVWLFISDTADQLTAIMDASV